MLVPAAFSAITLKSADIDQAANEGKTNYMLSTSRDPTKGFMSSLKTWLEDVVQRLCSVVTFGHTTVLQGDEFLIRE